MDKADEHPLNQDIWVSNSDHTKIFNTSSTTTTEQECESPTVASSNSEHKLLEPIIFETHVNKDQRVKIKYEVKTSLSYFAFTITKPKYIIIQTDPFLIHLKAHSSKKRTDHYKTCVKSFHFKGLQVLQKRKTHLYFQPSSQCKNIFKKQIIRANTQMRLQLTETAMKTRVNIRRLAYLGTLQPILLCKHLHTDEVIHNQLPHTSGTR